MSKTSNDFLAEYVREKRPEIERSFSYVAWKMGRVLGDMTRTLVDWIKEIDPQELEQYNKSIIGKEADIYIADEACCQEERKNENNA